VAGCVEVEVEVGVDGGADEAAVDSDVGLAGEAGAAEPPTLLEHPAISRAAPVVRTTSARTDMEHLSPQ
jgi:hypothetical protein